LCKVYSCTTTHGIPWLLYTVTVHFIVRHGLSLVHYAPHNTISSIWPKGIITCTFPMRFPNQNIAIYFPRHLHVTCYKTHIMTPLNMQLPVTPNSFSLNISLSSQFPNTLSLQVFPLCYTVFCGHTKQSINTHVYISITVFQIAVPERKAVSKSHSKYYPKTICCQFLDDTVCTS
jgi:hypothetical protein